MKFCERIFLLFLPIIPFLCHGQEATLHKDDVLALTIGDAVDIARRQSPDILVSRHGFRSSYWNYTYYKANYLPSLTLTSRPNFYHQINVVNLPDGASQYVEQNQLITDGALSVTQNIPWTGGSVSVETGLQRLDLYGDARSSTYKSNPVIVSYSQSLFGYNSLKWDRKIEPLRYEEAKKNYVEALELVAAQTILKFFNLARAQTNLNIAKTNYANADTLYTFAKGRYNIGTITENEMLQLEVNRLNEESNMLNAQIEVDDYMQELRYYLGITDKQEIEVAIDDDVPQFSVSLEEALVMASENSPDIINMKRRKLESESNVAYAKSLSGFKADLFAQLGLTQTGSVLDAAYKNPFNQQYVELGVRLPILDWGRAKGRIRVAKSNRDMVYTQVEQNMTNFELNVTKVVKQFNLQINRVNVAAKTDRTANRRNDVARRLYILGQSTILDLNAAISEKDTAKRNYINCLYNYWSLYYTLRSLTLYDFEKNRPLTEDYDLLLK
ncbi:MAG: TolC family protein [Tannerella sp.]|jgi:outer membrane protein TolC|nr:TolC family protein [Tannerella sp.]